MYRLLLPYCMMFIFDLFLRLSLCIKYEHSLTFASSSNLSAPPPAYPVATPVEQRPSSPLALGKSNVASSFGAISSRCCARFSRGAPSTKPAGRAGGLAVVGERGHDGTKQ